MSKYLRPFFSLNEFLKYKIKIIFIKKKKHEIKEKCYFYMKAIFTSALNFSNLFIEFNILITCVVSSVFNDLL